MAIKEFRLPDPGEGLVEADIVTWHVKVGDRVAVNDIVVEVETSKSLVELPIPFEGEVSALLVSEGDTVDVGTPIIRISDGAGEPAPAVDPVPALPPSILGRPSTSVRVRRWTARAPTPSLRAGWRISSATDPSPRSRNDDRARLLRTR